MLNRGINKMDYKYKNAVELSKYILKDKVECGDTVIDATCGNGHDSLLLSNLSGKSGKVYCFDISPAAIENTKKRLDMQSSFKNYVLICDSHENMDKYVEDKIKAVVFNLGYLPGGDHSIITKPASTIAALKKAMDMLLPGGVIIMTVYYGHDGGKIEKEEVIDYTRGIDSHKYTVIKTEYINQANCPPILITIEKNYGHAL